MLKSVSQLLNRSTYSVHHRKRVKQLKWNKRLVHEEEMREFCKEL